MSEPKWPEGRWELIDRNARAVSSSILEPLDKGRWPYAINVPFHPFSFGRTAAAITMDQGDGESLAIAQLFTAAADLYEALDRTACGFCLNRIGFTGPFFRDGDRSDFNRCMHCKPARAAIAKARGEA